MFVELVFDGKYEYFGKESKFLEQNFLPENHESPDNAAARGLTESR